MPRITKVKNQAATPAPATTPTMEEVAEKPIVQQILEAFDEKPTQPETQESKSREATQRRGTTTQDRPKDQCMDQSCARIQGSQPRCELQTGDGEC